MSFRDQLYREWLGAFEGIGTRAISVDTAARILAVVYVHGNNEAFVYNEKFLADIYHIRKMYHIDGSEIPNSEIAMLVKRYVDDLEKFYELHKNDKPDTKAVFKSHVPQWAKDLFIHRYNIKLIN